MFGMESCGTQQSRTRRWLDTAGDYVPTQYVPRVTDQQAARGLGVVSLAIGLTELLFAKQLDRFLGTGNGQNANVFRVLGVRELGHGVDLLSHDDPTIGVQARVVGDALDGALLGVAATKTRKPSGIMMAMALVLPVVIADIVLARRLGRDD